MFKFKDNICICGNTWIAGLLPSILLQARNEIYTISQVIGMISAKKRMESFISIWVVVMCDEPLSITMIGEYCFVIKIGVNLVSPLSQHCRIFCSNLIIGCACVIYRTESFRIICHRSEALVRMGIYSMGCRVNGNRMAPHYNTIRIRTMERRHGGYKLFVSCRIFLINQKYMPSLLNIW